MHVWPHLLAIEFAATLSLMAFVTIFSALVKAPLLGLADVNQTPNPSKAPWYFLGLQELLKMFQPMVVGVTIPGVALALLAITPYVDKNPSHKPGDRKFAIVMMTMFLMMLGGSRHHRFVLPRRGLQLRVPVEQGHLLRVVGALVGPRSTHPRHPGRRGGLGRVAREPRPLVDGVPRGKRRRPQ